MRSLAIVVALAALMAGAARAADPVAATMRVEASTAVVELAIAAGWHVNAHDPGDAFMIPTTVDVTPPAGASVGAVRYPQAVTRVLPFSDGKALRLYEGTVRIQADVAGAAAGGEPLRARLRYQACDDTTCLPPRTVELTATRAAAAPTPAARAAGGDVAEWIARIGWTGTLAWVLVLGAALNLTPCVYPLISVTVAFFGGTGRHADARTGLRAAVYVLGICLTFSALGAVAALTGSLFGAALQQPLVLGGIALLMVALALANFGLYQLRLPSGVVQWAGRTGEGVLGALFMGLTMGVVAAPCIGPIVVALLVYVGARQSIGQGLALFFTLGLGLGLPYLGLALVAERLRRLPRSGAWLEWMESLFGFMLLGLALHFATPLLPAAAVRWLWALVLVAGGLVLGLVGAVRRPAVWWARAAAGIVLALAGAGSLLLAEPAGPIAWTDFSDQALAAATAAGRPVLIDFQALWCVPCREMEQTTFRDPAVVQAARAFATLRADVTAENDASEALMKRFGVPGVPTYILLDAHGAERRRFVGLVAAREFDQALREVAGAEAGRG
jgi:thiol:disulfide interchange protein DsbD